MTNSILGALINGAFVAALLGGAVWAGLALAPRRLLSANARYAVWWTTLVAALLLPLGYLPSRQAGTSRPASAVPALAAAPLLATNAPASLPRPLPSHRLLFPLVLTAGGWPRWLLEAWAVVSGLMLIRLLSSCRLLERRKAGAAPAPDHLTAPIDVWLARRGCRRRAAMLSAHIATPVLAGLRRPAILIPERLFAELTEDELLQIGLHEAAHLARRDDYALFVQRAVEALLPVHPVVRWIARQIDLERELACDDLVVGTTGAPREYAACLARVVELCGGARPS